MAKVGCLGDIPFTVNSKQIQTIRDVTMSGSVALQSHERHLQTALVEFTGVNADEITLTITVSKYLGVNPLEIINKIKTYEQNGKLLTFMLGSKKYGKYRWLISKHSVAMSYFDGKGNLTSADISITLTEYVKE